MPRLKIYAAKYAMSDLGAHIKGRAKAVGMRQQDLGQKLGITQQGISKLLKTPEKITIGQLRDICSAIEIDSRVLLKAIGIKEE